MTRQKVIVLLVEDNLGDANLISVLLEEANLPMELVHVKNGEEAISYLRERKEELLPDLILLDLKMPRMDGLEFLRERLNDPILSSIPAVVLTGSDARSDREEAMAMGADMYVMKPSNIDDADMIMPTLEMFIKQRNLNR